MTLHEPKECPFFLISRAALSIGTALKQAFAEAGADKVRPAYLGVLMSLWLEDGVKSIDLCRRAGLEPSSMTGLIDRMERDGLVIRKADPEDRRAHRIYVTEAANRLRATVEKAVEKTEDEAFEGVDATQLELLMNVLQRILTNSNRLNTD